MAEKTMWLANFEEMVGENYMESNCYTSLQITTNKKIEKSLSLDIFIRMLLFYHRSLRILSCDFFNTIHEFVWMHLYECTTLLT